jgi:hypothetical protein
LIRNGFSHPVATDRCRCETTKLLISNDTVSKTRCAPATTIVKTPKKIVKNGVNILKYLLKRNFTNSRWRGKSEIGFEADWELLVKDYKPGAQLNIGTVSPLWWLSGSGGSQNGGLM